MAATKITKLYKRNTPYPVAVGENPRVVEDCTLIKIEGRMLTWRRPNGEIKRTTAPTNSRPRWYDNP